MDDIYEFYTNNPNISQQKNGEVGQRNEIKMSISFLSKLDVEMPPHPTPPPHPHPPTHTTPTHTHTHK